MRSGRDETGSGLVDGYRREGYDCQHHAANTTGLQRGYAGNEPEPDRDPGRQAREHCGKGGEPSLGSTGDHDLGRAVEDLERSRGELPALGGDAPFSAPRDLDRNYRDGEGHEQERPCQHERRGGNEERDQDDRCRAGDPGDKVGEQDPQPEVRKPVDVIDET